MVILAIASASLTPFLAVADSERDGKSEQPVAFGDLPVAVQLTIKTNAAGNAVNHVVMGGRSARKDYEAKFTDADGAKNTIIVAADGALIERRTEVDWKTLPAAVQSTIKAKANGAKIDLVEMESKDGQQLRYEVHLTVGDGTKTEIHVGQDGSLRDHEHGGHGEKSDGHDDRD